MHPLSGRAAVNRASALRACLAPGGRAFLVPPRLRRCALCLPWEVVSRAKVRETDQGECGCARAGLRRLASRVAAAPSTFAFIRRQDALRPGSCSQGPLALKSSPVRCSPLAALRVRLAVSPLTAPVLRAS